MAIDHRKIANYDVKIANYNIFFCSCDVKIANGDVILGNFNVKNAGGDTILRVRHHLFLIGDVKVQRRDVKTLSNTIKIAN